MEHNALIAKKDTIWISLINVNKSWTLVNKWIVQLTCVPSVIFKLILAKDIVVREATHGKVTSVLSN